MKSQLVTLSIRLCSIWFARSVLGYGIIGTIAVSIVVGVILTKINS